VTFYETIIYDMKKNVEKAKEYYQKALKINPKYVPAANNLAYIYTDRGENIDEALAQMSKEMFPDDPAISDTLGWAYYKKNIFTRAITYCKEAVEKLPDHPIPRYHLGIAYYKNGDKELAKKELKKALELDPKFSKAQEAKEALEKLK